MRVSYKWLQNLLKLTYPRELADRPTLAGVTVEGIAEPGLGLRK